MLMFVNPFIWGSLRSLVDPTVQESMVILDGFIGKSLATSGKSSFGNALGKHNQIARFLFGVFFRICFFGFSRGLSTHRIT